MIKLVTWNIHNSDGSYVGQSSAFQEEVALERCMAARGDQVMAGDIETDGLLETPPRLTYKSKDYFITPLV